MNITIGTVFDAINKLKNAGADPNEYTLYLKKDLAQSLLEDIFCAPDVKIIESLPEQTKFVLAEIPKDEAPSN